VTRPLVPPGAGIAVVSPAAPAAHTMPLRLELGLRWLADAGYRPRLMPSAAGADPHPEPAERVADLHAAFADPDTRLVLGAIGGNSAVTLLPLLDPGIAREHRAATQGGSDLTSLLWFLHHHAGTPAIYGPMAAMGLAEQPAVLDVTARGIAGAWSGQPYECRPGEFWTEERLRIDAGREAAPHTQHRAASGAGGWRAPRGGGRARGRLLAGCLEALPGGCGARRPGTCSPAATTSCSPSTSRCRGRAGAPPASADPTASTRCCGCWPRRARSAT